MQCLYPAEDKYVFRMKNMPDIRNAALCQNPEPFEINL